MRRPKGTLGVQPSTVRPTSAGDTDIEHRVVVPAYLANRSKARWALGVLAVACMLIPQLEIAIGASAVVSIVATVASIRWTNRIGLPASLRLLRTAVVLFTVGIVVRVAESASAGGELVFPGFADLIILPAYLAATAGVAKASLSRHALAKTADLVDAAAISIAAITVAVGLSASFLFSDTIDRNEQILAMVYTGIELAFLAVFVMLLFGAPTPTRSSHWLAVAGVYTTAFDTLVNILYAQGQGQLVDQLLRTMSLPVVAYALATSYPGYGDFARPGTRKQRHRWSLYAVCLAVLTGIVANNDGTLEIVGLVLFGVVASARLRVAYLAVTRLTLLSDTQTAMAVALADTDSTAAALEVGVDACRHLLPPNVGVTVASAGTQKSAGRLQPRDVQSVVTSHDGSLEISVNGPTQPHQWSALVQVADVLSFAVASVEARTARITASVEANWRALSGSDNELVFIVTPAQEVAKATPNAALVFGSDPIGSNLSTLLGHDLSAVLNGSQTELLAAQGGDRWLSITAQSAGSGTYVVTVRDASARVRAELVDPVTGLNNMTHFARHAELNAASLLLFRIDSFARINDSLGKRGADLLLRLVADRIVDTFRTGIDEVWRGDGPSFVVLCPGTVHSDSWVGHRTERISQMATIDGIDVHLSLSASIVPITEPIDADTALHRADLTFTDHSRIGDSVFRFTEDIEEAVRRRYRIEEALSAVSDPSTAGFRVHYQPMIDAVDGVVTRVEALLRWTHPTLGSVSPAEFIAAAERTGRVAILDQFVMEVACEDLTEFAAVAPRLEMQVNLSPVGLSSERIYKIADWTRANLRQPSRLTIELTESAIGDEFEALVPSLIALREVGVGLSCDDFGVGESNMSRLARLPWTQVKLAGIFATDLHPTAVARVVETIKVFGYEVVVENVEQESQARAMRAAGADVLQGWLISKDLPACDLINFLTLKATSPT